MAVDHGCEPVLPLDVGPPFVGGLDVAVRTRLLAQLPLLPRPRHVGPRDVRPPTAAPGPPRLCPVAPRLPRAPSRSRASERATGRILGRDVPVGELPAPR